MSAAYVAREIETWREIACYKGELLLVKNKHRKYTIIYKSTNLKEAKKVLLNLEVRIDTYRDGSNTPLVPEEAQKNPISHYTNFHVWKHNYSNPYNQRPGTECYSLEADAYLVLPSYQTFINYETIIYM